MTQKEIFLSLILDPWVCFQKYFLLLLLLLLTRRCEPNVNIIMFLITRLSHGGCIVFSPDIMSGDIVNRSKVSLIGIGHKGVSRNSCVSNV